MNKHDLEKYQDVLDWEMDLYQQQQGLVETYTIRKPMKHVDYNWQALKNERLLPKEKEIAKIEKLSNISIISWMSRDYLRVDIRCDVYRDGIKTPFHKNAIMDRTPSLSSSQYRIWDLVYTDASLNGCQARRGKIYEPNNAEDETKEIAYFEIWKNHELIWACLIVENYILPLRIQLDQFGQYVMKLAWKNRKTLDLWYEENI